jgi:hypothetical protein
MGAYTATLVGELSDVDVGSVDVDRPSHRMASPEGEIAKLDPLDLSQRLPALSEASLMHQDCGPWFGPDEAANLPSRYDACADL